MKTYPSHLLLLKGEDRTEEIANFKYEKGKLRHCRSALTRTTKR